MKKLFLVLALCMIPSAAFADVVVIVSEPHHQPVGYEWKTIPSDPSQLALMQGGVQVGAWSYVTGVYRQYDAGTKTWGAFTAPPVATPVRLQYFPQAPAPLTFPQQGFSTWPSCGPRG